MRKFTITFHAIADAQVSISYGAEGKLVHISFAQAPQLSHKQIAWLKNLIPELLSDAQLQFTNLIIASKNALAITESDFDVSFDTFWTAYNYKRNRIRTEKLYDKLNYPDKLKAIQGIAKYDAYLKREKWLSKQLPETYLKERNWEASY